MVIQVYEADNLFSQQFLNDTNIFHFGNVAQWLSPSTCTMEVKGSDHA
jgi:hypothetical protein